VLLYLLAFALTWAVSPLAAAHLGVPVDVRDNDAATGPLASPALSPAQVITAPVRAVATLTIANMPLPASTPQSIERTDNILLLAGDNRTTGDAWRTGMIMVVALDRQAGRAGMLSIPGDLWVGIPGHGQERINAAGHLGEASGYGGGGPALLQRVIQENLGIPTQHYLRINEGGIARLVDALGGVEVTLACPLYEAAPATGSENDDKRLALPAGKVYLDGQTAEQFAAYDRIQGDAGRQERQQQLVWAIHERAVQGDLLPHLPELWQAVSGSFTTDLDLLEIVRLAGLGLRLKASDMRTVTLTGGAVRQFTTGAGEKVLMLDAPEAIQARMAALFPAPSPAATAKPMAAPEDCPRPPPGFPDLSRPW
jgi:LCP family protein required for cell wall assembly